MCHMLVLGGQVFGFRTLTQSMFTLLGALLGNFDFQSMLVVAPRLAPVLL